MGSRECESLSVGQLVVQRERERESGEAHVVLFIACNLEVLHKMLNLTLAIKLYQGNNLPLVIKLYQGNNVMV